MILLCMVCNNISTKFMLNIYKYIIIVNMLVTRLHYTRVILCYINLKTTIQLCPSGIQQI